MNKNILIGLIVILVIVGGGMFLANSKSATREVSTGEKMDTSTSSGQEGSSTTSENQNLDNNSKYVEYSKGVLDQSKIARRVLFFYASWCPTCRPTDADLKENISQFPEDLVLIRVNYNDPETDQEEKELAKKYAITYQHTFVQIDSLGNEVTKWNGGKTEELLVNLQ